MKIAFKDGKVASITPDDTEIQEGIDRQINIRVKPSNVDQIIEVSDAVGKEAKENIEKVKLSKDKKSVDVVK